MLHARLLLGRGLRHDPLALLVGRARQTSLIVAPQARAEGMQRHGRQLWQRLLGPARQHSVVEIRG